MKRRGAVWFSVVLLSIVLVGCGGDTSKNTTNNDDPKDAANNVSSPDGGNDAANNTASGDAGNNSTPDVGGDDMGGGGDDMGGGGDDMGGGGDDMGGGGDDMGGDDMTAAVCGNGIIEGNEECDDGNTAPDDGCSPDCMLTCGDGVVGANEKCDIAIPDGDPGACPTACDDGEACTQDTLMGTECQAECVFGDITACSDGDSCCPMMCDATTDNDCMPVCGNGVLEGAETCDGDCPASDADCDDMNSCTTDTVSGDAATCSSTCTNTTITACTDNDGCCPPTCDSLNDSDCSASCGNGTIEGGETCDGDCPTTDADCDDSDVCTTDTVSGSAANCTATCTNTALGCDLTADGCCPVGCDSTTDADCTGVCGNSVVEAPETCDDGNTTAGDGCDENCQQEATAFRMTDLDLRDPHVYVDIFGSCADITDQGVFGQPSVNEMLQTAIQTDDDGDGLLDISFLAIFRPLDQADGYTGTMSVAEADCTAPMSSTTCTVDPAQHSVENGDYTNDANNDCLDVIAGTTTAMYSPDVAPTTPPCFSSEAISLTVDIDGILIPLTDVQIAATYLQNPATDLGNGLMRGFISEADADNITLPGSLPLVGGDPLSSVLPGGQNACPNHDDRDVGPDGVTMGWWFYFNYPATEVPFTEL